MISSITKRRVLSRLGLIFIGLALAVFGWGTGYKLSLYYPPNSNAHLMPHAKLLSKNEQDAPKTEDRSRRPSKDTSHKSKVELALTLLFVYALSAVAWCSMPVAVSQREREASRQLYRRLRASLSFFFVLPPPLLA